MAQESLRIGQAELTAFVSAVFVAVGLSKDHADAWAKMLVWANLRGTDSHGIIRIPRYIDLVNAKSINAKPNIRLAMSLYGFQMAFWVRKDSPIQSVADLKGKNIPSDWVQQTTVITHLNALLAAGGVTMNDVKKVPTVNVIRASEDFKSGKIDIFFFAVGAPKVQEISAAVGGLRVLPMEILPDSEKRMKAIRPEYYFSTVNPAPHIAGIDKPTKVQTIDFIIGVGTHVKDDVVRDFIKAVSGNKKALVEGHPNFNAFDPKQAGKRQARLPFHPAAEKYWKEQGLLGS